MLEFLCPTCNTRVQGDNSLAGKTVLCPNCNATMSASKPHADAAITESEPPPPRPSTDGAFAEGLPPAELPLPSLRKATPHIVWRLLPYVGMLAVCAILVMLLVPAVEKVRESAARTQSTNNIKQVALCFASYHDVNKGLPFNGTVPAKASGPKTGSWAWQISPYINASPLFSDGPEKHLAEGIAAYMCPGRGRRHFCTTGMWSDYAINPWLNDPKNGTVNAPHSDITMVGITDGVSNTIFVGHASIDPDLYQSAIAIPQSTDIFKGGDPATARRLTTNQRDKAGDGTLTWGGPFPQGSLMGMGDGTVRMFPYSMKAGVIRNGVADNPFAFAAFLTPTGGEAVTLPD